MRHLPADIIPKRWFVKVQLHLKYEEFCACFRTKPELYGARRLICALAVQIVIIIACGRKGFGNYYVFFALCALILIH